ncbi:MAG: hypothetical protein WBW88_03185 [Rhodothermales bacterium]|jgi:hypothetical protein
MADQTITCNGSCYNVDNEQVDKNPNSNIQIAAPVGATLTWDTGTPVTPPLSKVVQAGGLVTWAVPANAAAGTYYYTPTGMGCDTPCSGPDRPSMKVS